MSQFRQSQQPQTAFTLLEVILALAILAGAIALLGEVMSIAGRSAADAEAEAQAQLLARSILDEITSGIVDPTQQTRVPLETDAAIPWLYTLTFTDTTIVGLSAVEILVEQDVEEQFRPVKFRLICWVPGDLGTAGEETESAEASGGEASGA